MNLYLQENSFFTKKNLSKMAQKTDARIFRHGIFNKN